jgi:hypothetical protein
LNDPGKGWVLARETLPARKKVLRLSDAAA